MNTEALIQNVFNIFIVSIILEFCIMAIFSITILKDFTDSRVGKSVRDFIIVAIALLICFKVPMFRLFRKVLELPYPLDPIISALVLARMTMLIRAVIEKIKEGSSD